MTNTEDVEWLRKRLDAIILLLLESASGGAESTTAKIQKLISLGFSQPEVAQVIGKRVNYVTAVLAGKRKSAASARSAE
jgi:hypothetical protein